MPIQQVAPVSCPNCGTRFNTPVESIIDASDPAVKSAFLRGHINVARCPQCGFTSMLGIPLLYYDPQKELALALVPNELHISLTEQEKVIGNLTNTLMNSLPAEQRKFYILNPKIFLTMDSLIKTILEADGITQEMLDAQRARVKLIEEFMQTPDEAALKQKVKEHDAKLDKEFFEVLTASMQAAFMEGDQAGAQSLYALRTLLARWSSQGRKVIGEIDSKLGLVMIETQEQLLERLQAAKSDEEIESLIAAAYPMLDYTFFLQLTTKIDEATKTGNTKLANELKQLRTKVLDIKAKHEEISRESLKRSTELLKEILRSSKPEKVLEERLDEIDESFFAVLSANIQAAQQQKQEKMAQVMEAIGNMALGMLQAKMAPETEVVAEDVTPGPKPEGGEAAGPSPILIASR